MLPEGSSQKTRAGLSRRQFNIATGGTVISALLVACGAEDGARQSATGSSTTKPKTITMRTFGGTWQDNFRKYVGDPFTADTGIAIEYDLTAEDAIMSKIAQAISAGSRPPVDVVYTTELLSERARILGLASPLDASVMPATDAIVDAAMPAVDGKNYYVGVYTYTYPIIYNPELVDLPEEMSWLDLLSEDYRDMFYVPASVQQLMVPLAKALNIDLENDDLAPLWDAIGEMRPNIGGVVDDSGFISRMQSGEAKMGTFIIGDGVALKEQGSPVEWRVPKEGILYAMDTVFVAEGIPAGARHWSQVLIDRWLEADAQSGFSSATGVVPVNTKAKVPAEILEDPAFAATPEAIEKYGIPQPVSLLAENQSEWANLYLARVKG